MTGFAPERGEYGHDQTSVNTADLGAVGDGVTDNTRALQTGLDACYARGGGVLNIPPGVFVTRTLAINSKTMIRGAGPGVTTLKLKSGTTGDLLTTVDFARLTGTTPVDADSGPYKFHLRDLTLDANKDGGAVGWCMRVFGVAYTVDHVEFWNGKLGGIYSEWRSTTGGRDMETFISNFKVKETAMGLNTGSNPSGDGAFGILWNGPHDTFFSNGVVATLDSVIRPESQPLSVGIRTLGPNQTYNGAAGGASGEVFNNVHVWGRYHVGWWPSTQMFCSNCIAEGAFLVNVMMNTASVWTGGTVYGNLGANGTTEVGFQFGELSNDPYGSGVSNCSRSTVTGVIMNNFDVNGRCMYFANTAGNNRISATAQLGSSAAFYKGAIFRGSSGDILSLVSHDHANLSVSNDPTYLYAASGVATRVKAGTPTDADFPGSLVDDGAIVGDSSGSKLWVRLNGAWVGVAVA